MYEQHFGLNARPFRAIATGPDVFVGPQTAKTMAHLKKALDVSDAMVTVAGPVGVGKTTLVLRSLNALGSNRVVIPVGRMQLSHDEVLELLLDQLGTRQTPAGTVQRFSLFRRLLKGFSDNGTRVFIVVEDACRIGSDALLELEALTSADAGVSDGANVILMGEPSINQMMKSPQLARLKQRVRLRETIAPLSAGEQLAYLKHAFRLVGGDFDTIFADGANAHLHRQTDGIPRVINTTVEMILGSAAEQKLDQITPQFITSVVSDECGMTAQVQALNIATSPDPAPKETDIPDPQPVASAVAPAPVVESDEEPVAAAELHVDTNKPDEDVKGVTEISVDAEAADDLESQPEPEPQTEPEVEAIVAAETQEEVAAESDAEHDDGLDEDEIPELIQDTLPNLSILAPELAAMPTPAEAKLATQDDSKSVATAAPTPIAEQDVKVESRTSEDDVPQLIFENEAETESKPDDEIPTLFSSTRLDRPMGTPAPSEAAAPVVDVPPEAPAEVAQAADPVDAPTIEPQDSGIEVPAWERDPTLAELRPDLEALERAMSYTTGENSEDDDDLNIVEEPIDKLASEDVPVITLDRAIQEKIDEATELLKKTTIDLAEVTAAEEAKVTANTTTENESKATATEAANHGGKNTEELQKISTELSKAKTIEDVDDQMAETLFGEEFSQIAAQVAAHVAANPPSADESANDDQQPVELKLDVTSENKAVEKPVRKPETFDTDDKMTATQRLRTVRALNGNFDPVPEPSESVVLGDDGSVNTPPVSGQQPESIEDQINTSMTQTLKALNVRPPPAINDDDDDDDEDEDDKGGFFSRFRRT